MALVQALRSACRQQQLQGAAASSLRHVRDLSAAAPNHLALIKELREMTGAPVTEVKAALQQSGWDVGARRVHAPWRIHLYSFGLRKRRCN